MYSYQDFKQSVKHVTPPIIWKLLSKIKITLFKVYYLSKSVLVYFQREPKNFKYKLAVTAIIKNEGRYIEEWIKYHVLVGVEKFYKII